MVAAEAPDLAQLWGPPPAADKGVWLRARLVETIHSGRLAAGGRLPGARELAGALGVSRGTVDAAYTQLTDEGFLRQQARRRPVVAGRPGQGPPTVAAPSSAAPPPTPGVPDPALFPHRAWAAASRSAMSRLSARDLGYPDPAGHPRLRAALADWLTRTRGVSATADQVHVTGGVSQAQWLLAHVLDAGVWAVEQPGSDGTRHLVGHIVRCHSTKVDADGLDPADVPPDAGAVSVTPSHQYPTGVLMPAERRRELVDSSRTAGRWVVEDDYDSHLAAPGVVPAAVQALAPDSVVLVGSLSKLLAPGIRLGWIVSPLPVADRLRELRQLTDLGGSVLTQLTVAELIGSGALSRHLRAARVEYGRRRAALKSWLAPDWTVSGIDVGVHAFVPTAEPAALLARLAGAGVPAAAIDDAARPGVLVSVAACRPR